MTDSAYPTGPDGQPRALEVRETSDDGRRFSPSASRNKELIAEIFRAHMPTDETVLEIASGSGEHGVHLCQQFPQLSWWFSDLDEDARLSQAAWKAAFPELSIEGPLSLDVTHANWPGLVPQAVSSIFCANMIHIAAPAAMEGLIRGAGELLRGGGSLFLYGPFSRNGEMVASNMNFDASLKSRNAAWGVRDLERTVEPLAVSAGLKCDAVLEMPANNLSVIFRKL